MWSDILDGIIPTCREFEDKLIQLVWRSRPLLASSASAISTGTVGTTASSTPLTSGSVVRGVHLPAGTVLPLAPSRKGSDIGFDEKSALGNSLPELTSEKERKTGAATALAKAQNGKGKKKSFWSFFSWRLKAANQDDDLEDGEGKPEKRPIRLFAPIYGGLGAGLSLFFIGSGVSECPSLLA